MKQAGDQTGVSQKTAGHKLERLIYAGIVHPEFAISYRACYFLCYTILQSYLKGGCDHRTESQFQGQCSGDFDVAITLATIIVDWARLMPDYFPENSDMGEPGRAQISGQFLTILKFARPPMKKAALKLISTAKTGDASATIGALKQLGGTCKSCRDKFKY